MYLSIYIYLCIHFFYCLAKCKDKRIEKYIQLKTNKLINKILENFLFFSLKCTQTNASIKTVGDWTTNQFICSSTILSDSNFKKKL